jgi:RNA-binding protein 39
LCSSLSGFAFFGFRDPKVANLCIQVMSGQLIAGRPLRTGWANSKSDQSVVSTEFPPNVAQRIRMVDEVLVRLNGTGLNPIYGFDWTKVISSQGGGGGDDDDDEGKSSLNGISSAAELAINAALGVSNTVKDVGKSISSLLDPSVIGNNDKPTSCILVHNMFDKDQETDAGWEDDLELEFAEECGRYGKLLKIRVMSKEVGGKIYALFETMEGALACAKCLAGRWFDKRQLRVEFVSEDTLQ